MALGQAWAITDTTTVRCFHIFTFQEDIFHDIFRLWRYCKSKNSYLMCGKAFFKMLYSEINSFKFWSMCFEFQIGKFTVLIHHIRDWWHLRVLYRCLVVLYCVFLLWHLICRWGWRLVYNVCFYCIFMFIVIYLVHRIVICIGGWQAVTAGGSPMITMHADSNREALKERKRRKIQKQKQIWKYKNAKTQCTATTGMHQKEKCFDFVMIMFNIKWKHIFCDENVLIYESTFFVLMMFWFMKTRFVHFLCSDDVSNICKGHIVLLTALNARWEMCLLFNL